VVHWQLGRLLKWFQVMRCESFEAREVESQMLRGVLKLKCFGGGGQTLAASSWRLAFA
jgi:hypothetical protein